MRRIPSPGPLIIAALRLAPALCVATLAAACAASTTPAPDCGRAGGDIVSLTFVCNGDASAPFHATFYNALDPPSAVFTYGNDQAIALSAPAASGSRYTAANVEFWEHHGEATVNWHGKRLTCIPRR